jgi:hypothetical protein
MEARLQESGRSAEQASIEELEELWRRAKGEEKHVSLGRDQEKRA